MVRVKYVILNKEKVEITCPKNCRVIETKAEAETRALQKCAPADTEFTKVDYTVTQKIREMLKMEKL